jgi:hypothetical protein
VGFLPEHVSPLVLAIAAMGLASFVDHRRWWLPATPALTGLALGFVLDTVGAKVHDVPLVPFVVEIATLAILCGIVLTREPRVLSRG